MSSSASRLIRPLPRVEPLLLAEDVGDRPGLNLAFRPFGVVPAVTVNDGVS